MYISINIYESNESVAQTKNCTDNSRNWFNYLTWNKIS